MNLSRAFMISQLFAVASSSSLRGTKGNRELNKRIIGGTQATEGRYSYAVSLQDGVGHFFCGGSLVAKDVILSAAHCMQNKAYQAVIGRHSLSSTPEGDVVNVKTQIPHPNYDSETTDNDFMILILDRDTDEDVDIVQLSPENITAGSAVTVMGWGDTDPTSTQTLAQELMETEVYVISNDECQQSSGTVGGIDMFGLVIGGYEATYSGRITDNMMCAKDNGEDSCQGDSGGPLVIHEDSGDVQVGVVSWGVGCADESFPGVYARISSQFDWIREQVCDGSSNPPAYFDCDSSASGAFETQSLVADGGTQVNSWTTITEEDFDTGLGLFDQPTNNANHYNNAMGRAGVVAITGGAGGHSKMQSDQISLSNSPFTEFKITFSFYAIQMENSDDLCLDYDINDGAITGEKCWSSLHAFLNSRWYDDTSLQFSAPDHAQKLRIGFRLEGDDGDDNVLIDSVVIQGRADGEKYSDISW
jgi:trypsin